MSKLSSVEAMMEHFHLPVNVEPTVSALPVGLVQDRLLLLEEELEELRHGFISCDKANVLDALVDLQVVLLGTVLTAGMQSVFDEAFRRVMVTNMAKVTGVNATRASMTRDIVKPEGWKRPDLEDLVQ